MAGTPYFESKRANQPPSTTSTMWAMVLGWVLLRLVAGGYRASRPASATPDARGSSPGFDAKQHAPASAAHEKGRGREAGTPTQIPARGWKDIAWRVYEEFGKDRVMSVAAGVTYYALLALFPAIAALVSVYGLFADPATIQDHLNALSAERSTSSANR
jgi:membrane protein